MLTGGVIVTTTLISYLMLGRKIRPHHTLACAFAMLGFVAVGIASLQNENAAQKYSTNGLIIGIAMVLASLFTQGVQANFEELILSKYQIQVQRMVGLEGFFGMIWIFMWIMIFSYIPCPDEHLCDVISP